MHGANRSGRPFTGDYAGILLYQTLHRFGFASTAQSVHANDRLKLTGCRITNAVKCLPPQNKPELREIKQCNRYLKAELAMLKKGAVVLALGTIAHQAVLLALGSKKSEFPFRHGARHTLPSGLILYDSYHCSRYNTQTKRLTEAMFNQVFSDIVQNLSKIRPKPKLRPWAGTSKLPYFLQDAFELRELQLLDRQILLAIDRQANKPALANVRSQLDKLSALAGHPVVYVTGALASYERRRLIEQKVPFIVPGNQLYLPDLGIDLREYFRQRPQVPDTALSPATQAMLITALLRKPWQADWQPAEIVTELGYTPMTLSRAVKELTAAGIATLHSEGRARRLHMERSPAETWEHAKPLLRNPVKRRVWAHPIPRVEATACPFGGPERLGALFDAYRAAMAHLRIEPGAMESGDAGRR